MAAFACTMPTSPTCLAASMWARRWSSRGERDLSAPRSALAPVIGAREAAREHRRRNIGGAARRNHRVDPPAVFVDADARDGDAALTEQGLQRSARGLRLG